MDESLKSSLICWRRTLHTFPEGGLEEVRTHDYIVSMLEPLKPDKLETVAGTGVKCVFYGKDRERAIAFRADMDALQIDEKTGVEFCSQREGYMHACGHDGHMSIALATAHYAKELRDKGLLNISVTVIFQPAEESIGGAWRMIEGGALEDPHVEHIFGLHLMPDLDIGKIGIKSGALMAGTSELDIVLYGDTAHGAMPHKGSDAIAAMCHIYTMIQTAISRENPGDTMLFSIGRVDAGTRRNILAGEVTMQGIARTFSNQSNERLMDIIKAAIDFAGTMFGIKGELKIFSRYNPVINDDADAKRLIELAGDMYYDQPSVMIAEDFSCYLEERPGVFYFLGCGDENHRAGLHSEFFNFDEQALLIGAKFMRKILDDYNG